MLDRTTARLATLLVCIAGAHLSCSPAETSSALGLAGADTPTVTLAPRGADVSTGASAQFAAAVTGVSNTAVTWKVQEANGGSVDGTGKYVAPGSPGVFHVVAVSAADPSVTGSAAVTVRSTTAPVRYIGVNIMWQAPWDETQLFADVLKQADHESGRGSWGTDQWPSSGSFRLSPIGSSDSLTSRPHHNGTYRLVFKGQANIASRTGVAIYNANTTTPYSPATAYNAATNTTTADVVVTSISGSTEDYVALDFSNADRLGWPSGNSANSRNTGITDAHMWRPGHYNATTSQPTAYFNSKMVDRLQPISVVRVMQTQGQAGNGVALGNYDANWSDRVLPGIAYAWHGIGFEEAVLLANLMGKDVWVCVPLHASDDYIRKMAQTFAFGSDRTTGLPYTGPYGSTVTTDNPRPAAHDPSTWTISTTDWYPPLDSARSVYLEYSNEIWNYNNEAHATMAANEVAAGDPWKIAWDGSTDKYVLSHRRNMAKAIQIGLEFRRAFGDAAANDAGKDWHGVQIRNTLGYMISGASWHNGTSGWMEAAVDYFDHVWGASSSPATLGPSGFQFSNRPGGALKTYPYYLYGGTSGPYLSYYQEATSTADALSKLSQVWDGATGVRGYSNLNYQVCIQGESDFWNSRGVRYSFYEVNHGFRDTNQYEVAASQMSGTYDVLMKELHYSYALPNFDVWVHFSLTENHLWGALPDLYDDGSYVGWSLLQDAAAGL